MTAKNYELFIIIPIKNEEKNLRILIPQIMKIMKEAHPECSFALILLDHFSTDNSSEIISEYAQNRSNILSFRLNRNDVRIGTFLRLILSKDLIKNCTYIITMDADLSHPPLYLAKMINFLLEGNEFVLGARYMKYQSPFHPIRRFLISKLFNKIVGLFLRTNISDYTTGYRAFQSDLISHLPLKGTDFNIHLEINAMLSKVAKKNKEIPIRYIKRKHGKTKFKYFTQFPRYFVSLLRAFSFLYFR